MAASGPSTAPRVTGSHIASTGAAVVAIPCQNSCSCGLWDHLNTTCMPLILAANSAMVYFLALALGVRALCEPVQYRALGMRP
jgi:hypothetical protein